MTLLLDKIFNYGPFDHIALDSRQVKSNTLFIAKSGEQFDGRQFIPEAIDRGAKLIISENKYHTEQLNGISILHVANLRNQLIHILDTFYKLDRENLNIFGVTGTNGKTSIAHLLAQVFKAGYIGTLGIGLLDSLKPLNNTTPSLDQIYPYFKKHMLNGLYDWIMEISSHGLEQHRVEGLDLKTAIFTNLSHDHLDYHGSMEAYAKAKYRLFLDYNLRNAIICIDDDWGKKLYDKQLRSTDKLSYGFCKQADIHPIMTKTSIKGLEIKLQTPIGKIDILSQLVGGFNISNLMAVVATMIFEGYKQAEVEKEVSLLKAITGRLEKITTQPTFIVDYAHTPDALEKALISLKSFCTGKLWCIFGCGGDRDRSKRAKMAAIASRLSDQIVITSDNPRSESPFGIIDDIKEGLVGSIEHIVIEDRSEAIKYAVNNAKQQDIVLVAGKGHEQYQIIGKEVLYFSDQQKIKKYFNIK